MIERVLPSGEIIEFPDTMTPEEITAALRDYVRSLRSQTAQEPRGDAEPPQATTAPTERPRLQRPAGPAPAPEPEPEPAPPAVGLMRAFVVAPYIADDMEVTPERQREIQQRAGRPARLDPPDPYGDDRFRDNMHSTWSVRYWPR